VPWVGGLMTLTCITVSSACPLPAAYPSPTSAAPATTRLPPACLPQLLPDLTRRSLVVKHGQQQLQQQQQQERRASEGSPQKQRARWQGVQHYHYTAWPDHGVPDSPAPLLRLCAELRAAGAHAAPILVHCSGAACWFGLSGGKGG
jgi:hypothetical protein